MTKLVTEDDLARAHIDPAFRQQFLAENLDRLLEALKKIRDADDQNADTVRQLREGADLVLPCLFAKTPYNPRAPSILVGS
jgi:hypothetical protein